MLKRHHLAETMAGGPLNRTAQRTLQEAAAWRKQGYRKIVLAGQSFGGYVSLEAADSTDDVDAVVALAPGVRSADASGRLDPAITDRILKRVKAGRLALVRAAGWTAEERDHAVDVDEEQGPFGSLIAAGHRKVPAKRALRRNETFFSLRTGIAG